MPRRPTTAATGRPAWIRSTLRSWTDRPMTSFHLVVGITFVLLVIGLMMVLSASSIVSVRRGDGIFSAFVSQAIFAGIGLVAFAVATRLPMRLLRTAAFPTVLISIVMLGLVLVIGKNLNGATSWFAIGPISVQPAEVAKVALLIWMGHVLASRRHTLRSLKQLLFPVFPIFAIMAFLIMRQPDLGTTVSLALIFFAVLFFAGAPWWIFGGLLVAGAGALYYLANSADYRAMRMMAFLHPNDVAYERWTYQLNQGLYGMGNGGLFGTGIGQSQVKWSALPHAESDFIFAIIGEEMGLLGTGLVLFLYALLAYTGMRIMRRNVDPFIRIVSGGITVWLVGQACINIGYVVGLLPVTGLTLPMISAGGTSLLVTMFVLGILANFARQEPAAAAALYSQGPGPIGRFLGLSRPEPGADTESPARRARRAARAQKQATKHARSKQRKAERAEKYRAKAHREDVRGHQGPTRPVSRAGDPRPGSGRAAGSGRLDRDRTDRDRIDRERDRDRTERDRSGSSVRRPSAPGRDSGRARRDGVDHDDRRSRPRDLDRRDSGGRPRSNDPAPAGNGRRAVTPSRTSRRTPEPDRRRDPRGRPENGEPRPRRTGERTVRP